MMNRFKNKIIDYLNDITLTRKLILAFSALIVLTVLIIGVISIYFSRKYLIESEKANIEQNMIQLNNGLDYFFEIYMDRTNLVFMSDELQYIMKTPVFNIGQAVEIDKKIKYLCDYIENDNKYPELKNSYYYGGNIFYRLYLDNDSFTSFGGQTKPLRNIVKEDWYKDFEVETRTFKWKGNEIINGEFYVSLSRRLVNFDSSETKGLLQVFIPVQRINNVIKSIVGSNSHKVYYVDDNNNNIIGTQEKGLEKDNDFDKLKFINLPEGTSSITLNHKNFLVGFLKSGTTGWKIIYLVPIEEITRKTQTMIILNAVLMLLALLLCAAIAYSLSDIITRRIKILVKKANMIGENNLKTTLSLKGNDELGKLDRTFDKMVERINNLIETEYKSQIMINRVKLELLQEQINPHLLYNTLAMVSYTAKKEGRLEIVHITDSLSNFYKGILSRGKTLCSFKEEVDMVKIYVDLIRYVYSIQIDVIFDIDETVYSLYTLKLLLQPVIENAIVHGIKPKKSGTIVLSIYNEEDKIEVLVSDDGIGMSKDAVDMFNSITSYKDIEKGYGFRNVIKRIKLFFGDNYGANVKSVPSEGTTIVMTLPIIKKEEADSITLGKG
ncbi:histidine kinase [Clostridium sp. SYSU_GA19001]|uniref:sensor histidine kinase n=1 Tax=Clostridium caldaquaticum TaxID=2940653 RepID=UPI00207799D4|nr:sensor histidine kinase [Clostridium caldaquaticum]MCM8709893.1 histidine kinase [Clostridium caldaquaticum]